MVMCDETDSIFWLQDGQLVYSPILKRGSVDFFDHYPIDRALVGEEVVGEGKKTFNQLYDEVLAILNN